MTPSDATPNGQDPNSRDAAASRLRRLIDVGQLYAQRSANRDTNDTNDAGNHDGSGSDAGTHNRARNPDDPPAAFHRTAREICDPSEIRANLVDTGTTAQALDQAAFERSLDEVVGGIYRTRAGAVVGPAQAAIGEQLKISDSTETERLQIEDDGAADTAQAKRLEEHEVPRLAAEVERRKADVASKEAATREAAATLDAERANGYPEGWRPGDLVQWVDLHPLVAVALALIALLINMFLLQKPVSKVETMPELSTYLVAAGLSLTFELTSAAAGYVFASLRLPSRLAGTIFVALFVAIMVKLVVGLDALRESKHSGVETLTAATLASCFVAGLIGYATAIWRDFHHHRELALAAGTALGDAVKLRSVARKALKASVAALDKSKQDLVELYSEIERLHNSAARAKAAAHGREAAGIKAEVRADAINGIATIQVEQERAAHLEWGRGMALLAYLKARFERLPDREDEQRSDATAPTFAYGESGVTRLRLAIVALATGAIVGFATGLVPVAVAAAVAALLLLLPLSAVLRRLRHQESSPETPPKSQPIDAQADRKNKSFLPQPDHMVAGHARGDASPGERQ